MTEELSQDSLRPHEASKDSGVSSEVQLSNSTGKSVAVQSNQNSQAPAIQNNQNNKKYDLGVLFVHGIGVQRPGDTLNAIYPQIKGEFINDKRLKYTDSQQISSISAINATIYDQHDGSNKNIAFRESHWNNLSNKTNIKNYMSNGPFSIGFLKACKYILISLLAACVSHAGSLAAFISLVLIVLLVIGQNISQVGSFTLAFILISVAIFSCVAWINKVGIRKISLRLVFAGIRNGFTNIRYLFSKNFFDDLRFQLTSLMWLYQQIDGISGAGSNGANVQNSPTVTVWNDIQNLVNECKAVTVVAHSMGAYLSVDAIQKMQDTDKDKFHLITFGSGFAPVSLLRYIGQDFCRTAGFILGNIVGLLSLFGSVYFSIHALRHLIFRGFSAAIPYALWGVVFVLIFYVIHVISRDQIAKSQAVDIKDKVIWQNHSFTGDIVGNSISSLIPESRSYEIPVYKVAHKIGSYFKKGSLMCEIVSSNILEMVGVHHFDDNRYVGDFKTFRILYVIFATAVYVIMMLIDLKFRDNWLGYLVLFTPFVASSIFLLRPVNNYIFSYSSYRYWDNKSGVKLDSCKLYLWSGLFGAYSGMVGFFLLYLFSAWVINL